MYMEILKIKKTSYKIRKGDIMGFTATVLKVFLASPGDTIEERNQVERIIHEWNDLHSEREKVVLLPIRWEKSISSEYSTTLDGQELINKRILLDSDILIMIFKSKLGSPTGRAESGTLEELDIFSKENDDKIGIFFCNTSAPTNTASLLEYQKVVSFREKLQEERRGIYELYDEKRVESFLTRQVSKYTIIQEFEHEKSEEIKENSINQLTTALTEGFLRPDELLLLSFMYEEGYNTIALNMDFKMGTYQSFLTYNSYKNKYTDLLEQTCDRLVDRGILEFLRMKEYTLPYNNEYEDVPQYKLSISAYDKLGRIFKEYKNEVSGLLNQCSDQVVDDGLPF